MDLISIVLTAVLAILGNVAYFEYKSRNEFRRGLLKEKLTKLLLPLYFSIHEDEFGFAAADDGYEYGSEQLIRLREKLRDIISQNIYLADGRLHEACMQFMKQTFRSNPDERFQILCRKFVNGEEIDDPDAGFYDELKKAVSEEYLKTRDNYTGRGRVKKKTPV